MKYRQFGELSNKVWKLDYEFHNTTNNAVKQFTTKAYWRSTLTEKDVKKDVFYKTNTTLSSSKIVNVEFQKQL